MRPPMPSRNKRFRPHLITSRTPFPRVWSSPPKMLPPGGPSVNHFSFSVCSKCRGVASCDTLLRATDAFRFYKGCATLNLKVFLVGDVRHRGCTEVRRRFVVSMKMRRHLPVNLTLLALAALLWQSEAQAREDQAGQ